MLHGSRAGDGVDGVDRAAMARHRMPDRGADQRPVERQSRRRVRGRRSTSRRDLGQPARRRAPASSPLSAAIALDADELDDVRGVVTHAEIALDGALHARLGQALRDDARSGRLVRAPPNARRWWRRRDRRPATGRGRTIPSHPSASIRAPSITAAGVGISTRSNSACARSMPLACTMRSMNTCANRRARGLDVEHVELRHHVLGRQHFPAGERRPRVVGRVAVAGEHDGARERAAAEHCSVMQDDLAVAAIGAAGKQQDVRRERNDARDVAFGQPVGECADQLRAGAERSAACRLGGQLAHEADGHHAQSAGRAARGKPVLERAASRQAAARGRRGSPSCRS